MGGWSVAIASIAGVMLGSFANVLIHRVPRAQSIVSPPSACPRCGRRIRARHNLPVVGWLWLRGRCADCGAPISPRYPLVEFGTAVAFGAITWITGPSVETLPLLGMVYFGIVLSAIDIEHRRLPDALTLAFAISTAASVVGGAWVTGDWDDVLRACWGALILGCLYLGAFVAYPKGMGFGDVKLAPTIGAVLGFFGWGELAVGGFAAFLIGGSVGVLAMVRARRGRGVAIPFGPSMFAGAIIGVACGEAVATWYFDLIGL